jgi:hypoxanthine phosphoribosyltransferase
MIDTLVKVISMSTVVAAGSAVVFVVLGLKNLRDSGRLTEAREPQSQVPKSPRHVDSGIPKVDMPTVAHALALRAKPLVSDLKLSRVAAGLAVADLDVLLRGIIDAKGSFPYLVGVNKGGGLVANFLAHRIGLHEKYLIKCDFRTVGYEKLFCEDRPVDTYMVVVDDVARTGRTVREVRRYLTEKYPAIDIYVACLVCVSDSSDDTTRYVDFYSWLATSKSIAMPWDSVSAGNATDYFDDLGIDQLAGGVRLVSSEATERAQRGDTKESE